MPHGTGDESIEAGGDSTAGRDKSTASDAPPTRSEAFFASRGASGGPGEHPGDFIGPYKLLSILGEGGFGVVWLAERREPHVQRVALKIIKPGMDSRAVIAHFEQERQALAVMDHPNVAKVYDAGATPMGRPYFVMEHVQGEAITTYCDRHTLTIKQRLELFIPVCEAVQHAHHKGIIHRDIKPSNILVTIKDGNAIPKVIDFGVAKAISHTLTEKTIFTEQGQIIGTPEYMSPEQAEMGALDVDTRTDVYSLGVVLYELLTGALPFESKYLRIKAYHEIRRIIREVDPPKPSTRLTSMHADESGEVAQRRCTQSNDLASELKRELEWIPLKALRKDRTARYDSPTHLAKDVRNYLEGRALEAGPESNIYRLRKLVRRNRGVFASVAAIFGSLMLGVVGFAWQAYRIGVQRDYAVEAQKAEVAARKAEQQQRERFEAIDKFIHSALQCSDPNQGGQQGMQVTDAMMRAVLQLDNGEFTEQPVLEATLRLTIAEILDGNGRSAEGLEQGNRALAIFNSTYGGDHPEIALAQNSIARCLDSLGRSTDALAKHQAALEMRQRLFVGDHPDIALSLNDFGFCLQVLGRQKEALPYLHDALKMWERLYPDGHPNVAASLNNVGTCLHALGRSAEALSNFEAALAMRQRFFKQDHPALAESLNNLASCLEALHRAKEALPRHEAALEMRQRLFKGDHPKVAEGLNNVASCLDSLGRAAEALPNYEAGLEMRQRLLAGDHPDVAGSLNNVALCLNALGRGNDALPKFEAALEMWQRLFQGDHPSVATAMNNVAFCLNGLGRSVEALAQYEDALDMRQRLYTEDHPDLAQSLNNVGSCLATLGRHADALAKHQAALEMRRRMHKGDHPSVAQSMINVGASLSDAGRPAEAEPVLRDALSMCERLFDGDHSSKASGMRQLALCLAKLDRSSEALETAKSAASMAARSLPGAHPLRKKCEDTLSGEMKQKTGGGMGDWESG